MRFVGIFTSVLISGNYYNGGVASDKAFKTSKSTYNSDGTSHIALRAWNKKTKPSNATYVIGFPSWENENFIGNSKVKAGNFNCRYESSYALKINSVILNEAQNYPEMLRENHL
jgi:hypothetical protein